jgi:hypothetical protein
MSEGCACHERQRGAGSRASPQFNNGSGVPCFSARWASQVPFRVGATAFVCLGGTRVTRGKLCRRCRALAGRAGLVRRRRIGETAACSCRRAYRVTDSSCRTGSADQRISGGWRAHGGAEARREQREESTTGPGGQLACPVLVLLPVVLERPWLPTGISTRAPVTGHPSCAGA